MDAKVDTILKHVTWLALGALLGAAAMWSHQFGPLYVSGPAKVIDGDNIKVDGHNVRLLGIDAPELPERAGKECRKLLSRPECFDRSGIALHWKIGGEPVHCWIVGSSLMSANGDWGRPLGVCFHGGTELNAWMLRECHADEPENPAHRVWRYRDVMAERDCEPRQQPVARLNEG